MSGETKASEVAPEALPVVTKMITSLREQKGKSKQAIVLINQAIKSAKVQVKYLKKLKTKYSG